MHAATVDIVDVNDVVATAATFHVAVTVDDVVALLTLLLLLLLLLLLFLFMLLLLMLLLCGNQIPVQTLKQLLHAAYIIIN